MAAVSKKMGLALAVAVGNEQQLVSVFSLMADRHSREADIRDQSTLMAMWSQQHIDQLKPFSEKYGRTVSERPERLRSALLSGTRTGGLGLLMDLKDVALLVNEQELSYTALTEASSEVRDEELLEIVKKCAEESNRQL